VVRRCDSHGLKLVDDERHRLKGCGFQAVTLIVGEQTVTSKERGLALELSASRAVVAGALANPVREQLLTPNQLDLPVAIDCESSDGRYVRPQVSSKTTATAPRNSAAMVVQWFKSGARALSGALSVH